MRMLREEPVALAFVIMIGMVFVFLVLMVRIADKRWRLQKRYENQPSNKVGEVLAMTAGGWMIMIGSVVSILTLVTFCMIRVLRLPPADLETHLKAPPDIDTRDRQDAD